MKIYAEQITNPHLLEWDIESRNRLTCHDHAEEIAGELYPAGTEVTVKFVTDGMYLSDGVTTYDISDDTLYGTSTTTVTNKTITV